MTPHRLGMTAFGPYVSTVSLDLDALSSAGLFLLHGPTGGGKTTLLDGIGFALFGRVPGARNGARHLRSDHAPLALRTEVVLEASFGARRIRITRSPAWERPKARGTGRTTEQARVLLEELVGGSWTVLSSRPREADDEVLDLVGMSAEQFFQVVLLPQGDFAQFLRASSEDRAALLEKLFSTERFGSVTDWLADRRRACSRAVGEARDLVDDLVARLGEAAGSTPEDEDVLPWASALLASAAEAESRALAEASAADGVRDAARLAAEEAVRFADLQARRRGALARRVALEAARPERLALQAVCDAAARAAEIAGALSAVASRRLVRDGALEDDRAARMGLDGTVLAAGDLAAGDLAAGDLVPGELHADELRAAAASARELTGRLEALRAVEDSRQSALAAAAAARADEADARAAAGAAELELMALPVRRAELEAHVAAARAAADALPALLATRSALAALRPDVTALRRSSAALVVKREEHVAARETALALETKAHELRVASVNSMVARLAFRLEDGMPCEVCGSSVHPDPSALRDEGVSADDELRAALAADEAQELVGLAASAVAAVQARIDALAERCGDWTEESLDERLAVLDLERLAATSTAERLVVAESQIAELDARRITLTTDQVAASSQADAAARRLAEASARSADAQAELEAAGAADLPRALAQAAEQVLVLERAAQAAAALDAAQGELGAALLAAENACHAAGFADVEQGRAAFRDAAWRERSAAELRSAADLEAALAAELADPLLAVQVDPPAPVAATATELADADRSVGAAHAVLGRCRQRREALTRLVPQLADSLAQLDPLVVREREVRSLADLCAGAGANGLKMTLASFVLAARLEEVAAAASARLLRMTQGRYELVHTDGAARGGLRSGLRLLVRDAWSGADRDTATLSGGETFLASLALALGLADVVTAEAGGSRIGALFVDEGFGTLDEESLDEVMDVLDGLREGGRVVGVVSHVAELRQRIPVRVEVRKTRLGSDVVVHGC